MTNLKACPFCGGQAYIARSHDDGHQFLYVKCGACNAQSSMQWADDPCPNTYAEIRERWNTRAEDKGAAAVAVVGPVYQLLWTRAENPLEGLRVGDLLYTNPPRATEVEDARTLMRFILSHFGDVSMSHHLTDDVVAAVRRIEAEATISNKREGVASADQA